jgi:hypothetical protein
VRRRKAVSAAGRNPSGNDVDGFKKFHLYEKEIVMKNTVKKILALVFAVVMVCSLAVPALAAEKTVPVFVTVVGKDGNVIIDSYTVNVPESRLNVKKALDLVEDDKKVDFTVKNGKLTEVNDIESGVEYFETDAWYVAVNGKLVNDDLSTVAIAKNNEIVVYWGDVAIGSKLVLFDAKTNISKGIVEFYYFDANGAKQPLVDATVEIPGVENALVADGEFVTDEKGQIWLAPEYLEGGKYTIASIDIADAKTSLKTDDKKYADEKAYYDEFGALNLVDTEVEGKTFEVSATLYETKAATGDMTMVYVLVAAAAVATLAAVVVLKKKSVKAH